MNRRAFLSTSSLATTAALLENGLVHARTPENQDGRAQPGVAKGRKPALMKVGATLNQLDDDVVKSVGRYGVVDLVASPPIADEGRLYATVDELSRMRETAERNGAKVHVVTPPNLASSHIDRERNPAIMLGQSPQRDRDIEQVQTMIRNCATAGIPCIKYNMSILGVLRTGRRPGRGDTTYTTFRLADARPNPPLTKAGVVSADMYWERIVYFLDRVIPVANEFKVRMALHPNDSMTPPEGYQGVHAVLSTVEGLKKFASIQESPYHGFNFCQGTVSEMLQDPKTEIYDVIRYFAERRKIFMVHFRNIKGNRQEFAEVGVDEGDIDFLKALLVYRDAGYDGMMLPDHAVQAPNDPRGEKYFAFAYGYIKGLIKAVDQLA